MAVSFAKSQPFSCAALSSPANTPVISLSRLRVIFSRKRGAASSAASITSSQSGLPDGIAPAGIGMFQHPDGMIVSNCLQGCHSRHQRFPSTGETSKKMGLNKSGEYSQVILQDLFVEQDAVSGSVVPHISCWKVVAGIVLYDPEALCYLFAQDGNQLFRVWPGDGFRWHRRR